MLGKCEGQLHMRNRSFFVQTCYVQNCCPQESCEYADWVIVPFSVLIFEEFCQEPDSRGGTEVCELQKMPNGCTIKLRSRMAKHNFLRTDTDSNQALHRKLYLYLCR